MPTTAAASPMTHATGEDEWLPRASRDGAVFLQALDALHQGLAFFDCAGVLLHLNDSLKRQLRAPEGGGLREELDLFVTAMRDLVRLGDRLDTHVVELAVRRTLGLERHAWLRGSYVGVDLFGRGASILVTVERSASDPFSPDGLRDRFRLSRQEARVARLLGEGRTNKQIARTLGLSTNTVRHYVEHVFQKLEVGSRAEVVSRILRE